MKKMVLGCLFLLVTVGSFAQNKISDQPDFPPKERIWQYGFIVGAGDLAPEFNLITDRGKRINSRDLRGKVVFLDFGSVTCGPCIAGMKHIQKELVDHYKNNKDVVILPIIIRTESSKDLKNFKRKHGFNFTFAREEGGAKKEKSKLLLQYSKEIPAMFVIDREGKIVFFGPTNTKHTTYPEKFACIRRYIDAALNK